MLTRLRQQLPLAHVVVYTGNESARQDAEALGAAGFVSKAEEISRLVGLLDHLARDSKRSASIDLPADFTSSRAARAFVVERLGSWECGHLLDDDALVVSELVANAIMHAETAAQIRIILGDEVLRIEVTDRGAGTPDPRHPNPGEAGGRGLQIVAAVAIAWGITPEDHGRKTVWAELAA